MPREVSIIVPVFRTEKMLDSCIQSILQQTFQSIELIIVNDGSGDDCRQIVSKYPKDKVCYLEHNQNRGLLQARISGVKLAKGNFISNVDSDDTISKYFIEKLLGRALECNADICHCAVNTINGEYRDWFTPKAKESSCPFDFYYRHLKSDRSLCNKLIRRSLYLEAIQHIPDLYLVHGEDVLQTFLFFISHKNMLHCPINYTTTLGMTRLLMWQWTFLQLKKI